MAFQLTTLFRRVAARSGNHLGWKERLGDVVERLGGMNVSNEKEFLFLCERLRDFHLGAEEISELSLSISARMSGEEAQAVATELQGVTSRIESLEKESQQGVSTLSSILSGFESLRKHIAVFEKVVMNLNMLCNSLRIESARIRAGDSGLTTLVDDVKQLAANIGLQSAHLLNETEAVGREIRENLTTMIGFKEQQQGRARFILDDIGKSMSSLADRHRRSSDGLKELASRWHLISESIGEIVSSIQFQDITRQRVEHVMETLNGYIEMLKPHSASIKTGTPEDLREAMTGCELQAAQLAHGKEEMAAAVERIIENLRNVSAQVGAMSQEVDAVSGWGGEAGHSYFEELKSRLSILVQVLTEYGCLSRELERATGEISDTIHRMSGLVKEIEKVGIDMNMIALNACIRAAHIGEEGLGLGVLSESLHQLSIDSASRIETISSGLKSLISAASGLSANTRSGADGGKEGSQMTSHLEEVVAPIHRLNMDTAALLSRVEESGKKLVGDIEKTVQGITVQVRVEEIVQGINLELNAMISEMRSVLPAKAGLKTGENLRNLAERYTMRSERKIHRAVLSKSGEAIITKMMEKEAGGETPQTRRGKIETEDLGENVELF